MADTPTFLRFDSIDSTSNEARRQVLADTAVHGTSIIAAEQTDGRGRHGRTWQSPSGNLYMSTVLLPHIPAEEAQQLVFVAAVAAAKAIAVPGISLKWPNDILLNGKKLAGVLVEAVHNGNRSPAIIIGIGVNVAHFPEDALYPATSLTQEKITATLPELQEKLAKSLLTEYEAWRREGLASVLESWKKLGPQNGTEISFNAGSQKIKGAFAGLDEHGAICLNLPDKTVKSFTLGEVM